MASDSGTCTTNSSARNDGDELLLVGAVIWDLPLVSGDHDSSASLTSKIRVRRRDIVARDDSDGIAVCKGSDLQRILKTELEAQVSNKPLHLDTSHVEVHAEVYDSTSDAYVSLEDAQVAHADVTQRFGTRLRIHVRVTAFDPAKINTGANDPSHNKPKAIMGRYYPYDAAQGLMIAGVPLRIQEIANQENAGTGVNVWDGALLLAQYLEKQPSLVQSKRVLELGAGCGLVGLAAGVLGAKQVLMTDLPYALANMEANTNRHADAYRSAGCEQIVCAALDWYHPPSLLELGAVMNLPKNTPWIPDLILIADCVWMQELVEPLLSTIQHLTQQQSAQPIQPTNSVRDNAPNQRATTPISRVLLSYQRRGKSTHDEFWNGLHSDRFQDTRVTPIDVTSVGLSKPESIYLLLMESNL